MPKIDIDNYIEQSGMRKARFGGYEPEDVHQAMEDLCACLLYTSPSPRDA